MELESCRENYELSMRRREKRKTEVGKADYKVAPSKSDHAPAFHVENITTVHVSPLLDTK